MEEKSKSPKATPTLDTNSAIVILLLVFVPIVGVILMWFITRHWPFWLKLILTIPVLLAILISIVLFFFLGTAIFGTILSNNTSDKTNTVLEQINYPTPFDKEGTPSPTQATTQQVIEVIETALEEKNYELIAPYLADNVNVLLYASECCGEQDSSKTLGQLTYFNPSTNPWNFDQNNPTILSIKQAHPETFGKGIVGISENKYTASFEIANGKIVGIYISVSYDLLTQ